MGDESKVMFESRLTEDVIIVDVKTKRLDRPVKEEFKAKLEDLISRGNKYIVINLAQVEFIDSSGVGALVAGLKLQRGNDGDIVLCGIKDAVSKVFEITGMQNMFRYAFDVNEGKEIVKSWR